MLVCLLPSKKYGIMLILTYNDIFCFSQNSFKRKFLKSLSGIWSQYGARRFSNSMTHIGFSFVFLCQIYIDKQLQSNESEMN